MTTRFIIAAILVLIFVIFMFANELLRIGVPILPAVTALLLLGLAVGMIDGKRNM